MQDGNKLSVSCVQTQLYSPSHRRTYHLLSEPLDFDSLPVAYAWVYLKSRRAQTQYLAVKQWLSHAKLPYDCLQGGNLRDYRVLTACQEGSPCFTRKQAFWIRETSRSLGADQCQCASARPSPGEIMHNIDAENLFQASWAFRTLHLGMLILSVQEGAC